jgi:hypothetical protein
MTFSARADRPEIQAIASAPRAPEPASPFREPTPRDYDSTESPFESAPAGHRASWERERDEHDRVQALLTPPAKLLLVTGILGLLADGWQALYFVLQAPAPAAAPAKPPANFMEGLEEGLKQGGPVPILFGTVFAVVSLLVIIAAVQMMRRRSYGLAMFGSILAMLNFVNCCCLLGLPAGIWGIVVLSKPEVKSAFQGRVP